VKRVDRRGRKDVNWGDGIGLRLTEGGGLRRKAVEWEAVVRGGQVPCYIIRGIQVGRAIATPDENPGLRKVRAP
jgi:hypothetical protein